MDKAVEVETLEAGEEEEEADIPEVEDTAEGEDQVAGEAVTTVEVEDTAEAEDQVAGEADDQVAGDVEIPK